LADFTDWADFAAFIAATLKNKKGGASAAKSTRPAVKSAQKK